MTVRTVEIRIATEQDSDAILAAHMNAFVEGPVFAKLVDEMLDDPSGEPTLSLVTEPSTGLVGHLLFTSVRMEPHYRQVRARIFAPLAVVQNRQRLGIGRRLSQAGFRQLEGAAVNLMFVVGYLDYYSRFKFKPATVQVLEETYPIPLQDADA
ncbi:GNAT family N-acetyltransferase [Rubripirellula reticaptiva]|uniref:GNAT family N-acetyltransferase n=1 Tax=Rubripirellula reticaptiva TaxID=2528013 RepID=UPI001FE5BBE5|nr:N-acetyltransferase [Rubripirellula reticaptiva]